MVEVSSPKRNNYKRDEGNVSDLGNDVDVAIGKWSIRQSVHRYRSMMTIGKLHKEDEDD